MYLQTTTKCNMSCEHCCFACTDKGEDISLQDAKKAIDEASESGDLDITLGGGEPTMHPQFWEIAAYAVKTLDRVTECGVFVITNGKRTGDALALAWLADHGVLSAELSQDCWHDPIEEEVVEAFRKGRSSGWKGLRHVPDIFAEALGYDEEAWYEDAVAYEAEEAEYEEREPNEIDRESLLESFWEMKSCELADSDSGVKGYRTVTSIAARGRGKNVAGAADRCACSDIFVAADASVWQCGCKRLKLSDTVWSDFYSMTPSFCECSEPEWLLTETEVPA